LSPLNGTELQKILVSEKMGVEAKKFANEMAVYYEICLLKLIWFIFRALISEYYTSTNKSTRF
jgi:hypothetical protein